MTWVAGKAHHARPAPVGQSRRLIRKHVRARTREASGTSDAVPFTNEFESE
jgi:prephenate dehydratase